jgi:tetratricopeptide (TPR) repeat protein
MLRLQHILQTYKGVEGIIRLETDYIFDDCNFNKGKVHKRFIEYDKAKEYLEEAHIHQPTNLSILLDLFSLYNRMSDISAARTIEEKILKLRKELLTQDCTTTELGVKSLSMQSTDPLQEKYTDSFPELINTEDLLVNEQSIKVLGSDSELLLFSN